MKHSLQNSLKTSLSPARITAIYVLIGGLWIVLSSVWASSQAGASSASEKLLFLELAKGLTFIAVTAALLWGLCRSWSSQIINALTESKGAESKYSTYIKSSPIGIAVIDPEGRIQETNAANATLTGYTSEELERMTFFDLDRSDSQEDTPTLLAEIFEKGGISSQRVIQRKDGTHLDVVVDGVRVGEDRAICFARDVSERIHYERKLVMLNAMLRAIRRVNQAIVEEKEIHSLIRKICDVLIEDRDFKHAWVALLDADGKPDYYCDAPQLPDAEKLKAFLNEGKLEDCLSEARSEQGLIISKHPHSDCPDFPIMQGLEDCALLGMRFDYDHRVGYIALMANREVVDDAEEISLFREVCGDLQYALHTMRVEREKIEAMQSMVEAKREAEQANQAKDDFLAVMSHEMRTPLNPIIGFSEMLLEDITSEPEKTYVNTILQAGIRQLHLVDDILQYMRLHRGNVSMKPEAFRIWELCRSVIHDTSANTEHLELDVTNGRYGRTVAETLEVLSDEQMLRSILDNLASNACKYTKAGHVRLDLSESESTRGEFILTVEDSGMGIAPETIKKLFEPFSQADSSYTRRHEGVGLGLAICRKLTELLGGKISATSRQGEGSTFTVRLPLQRAAASNEGNTPKRDTNRAPALLDREVDVLAVDDKPDNLFVLEKMLTRAGARLSRAEDGAVAVKLCQEHVYDVILMDLAMPVMNGLDASEAIRARGLNMETPIIAVTADATAEARESAEKVGMRGFVTKPIQMRELIDAIRRHVN